MREVKISEKEKSFTNDNYPEITQKDIQKMPYNFGKAAIGTYMLKLIKKGYYDRFLEKKLGRDRNFLAGFKLQ